MPLWLAVAVCVLVAGWRARDVTSSTIDVERGLRWFFGMMTLAGWGLLLFRTYHRDRQFEQMWDIAWGVTTMAHNQGVAVDSLLSALREIEDGRFAAPAVIVPLPEEPPAVTVSEDPRGD